MIRNIAAGAVIILLAAGCARPYTMPADGEPAATVKIRVSYDHAKAVAAFPPEGSERRLTVEVDLTEEGRTYHLAQAVSTQNLDRSESPPLDVLTARVHPGRDSRFTVRLSTSWKLTGLEYVWKEERKPKQVTRQERVYNVQTRSYEYQTRTVTDYETERKQVLESVTREHTAGCSAAVGLRPEQNKVYQLDYTNLLLTEGCTLKGYREESRPDGSIQLIGM